MKKIHTHVLSLIFKKWYFRILDLDIDFEGDINNMTNEFLSQNHMKMIDKS